MAAEDDLEVELSCPDGTNETLLVEDLEIELAQPAFGIDAKDNGDKAFPIGALVFEGSFLGNSVPYSFRGPNPTRSPDLEALTAVRSASLVLVVAFSLPCVPRRLLPEHWYASSFWRDTTLSLANAAVAAAATEALRSVFDDAWVGSIPEGRHEPHPFEYWYALGGGVSRLLRLGYCLHTLSTAAAQVRPRLRHPASFDAAEAEVRTAAVLADGGARLEWIGDHGPELIASWGSSRAAVKVEQLGDGKQDEELGRVDAAFERGLMRGRSASLEGRSDEPSSQATLVPEIVELESLFELDDLERTVQAAERMGFAYGESWGRLVACTDDPGRYEPRPGLVVEIREGPRGQHGWNARGLSPGAHVDYARLAGNALRRAEKQIRTSGLPGIALIERRWPPTWAPGVRELVARALESGRFGRLGAVWMREAERQRTSTRTAEVLHVLPGADWDRLPSSLRLALPPGSHVVDLPGARRDDLEHVRAMSPARRFEEARSLMRLGYRMQWARLRRENPEASDEDLNRLLRAWSDARA